jgi:hypothetical protein
MLHDSKTSKNFKEHHLKNIPVFECPFIVLSDEIVYNFLASIIFDINDSGY